MEEVLELIKDLQADKYKEGLEWNGYKVYEPIYEGTPCVGPPLVVLEDDDNIRYSTVEECFKYLEFKDDIVSKGKTSHDLKNDLLIKID